MSKDPAFLFYSSDFLTGTMLLTMEQKGKYITLLCLQHQKGILTEKDMLQICGTYDEDIFSKFVKDENGNYLNERLSVEVQKRKAYSESRRQNRTKKDMNNISNSYVPHMENENVNRIVIKNKVPTLQEFIAYANLSPDYEFTLTAKYEQWKSDGWMDGNGKKIKNWKTKLKSTIPYLRPFKQEQPQKINYLND